MKLMYILLIGLFIQAFSYGITKMNKYGSRTNYYGNSRVIYYMELKNNFNSDDTLYFEMTAYHGQFYYYDMYYLFSDDIYNSLDLNIMGTKYYSTESTTSSYYNYYYEHSLGFKLDNRNYKYIYFSYPEYYGDYSSLVTVKNVSSLGLAIAVIIVIVVVVVIVIAASIIVFIICKRRRYRSYVDPPVAVYAPPIAPAYPPPTYY